MPRYLAAVALLLAVAAAGCSSKGRVGAPSSRNNGVTLDQEFELAPGQSALIGPEPLRVTFEAVTADSRCPPEVQCVWEGDAVAKVLAATGSQSAVSYELHTHTGYATQITHGAYRIRLVGVAPTTRAGVAIDPAAYVITLLVTKP